MISGAAATTLGPPTCGATARSTPRMSSGVAPSSSALAICQAYEAGGASSAIRVAIFTSEKVRPSRPLQSRSTARSPISSSSRSDWPDEMPDRVLSGAVCSYNGHMSPSVMRLAGCAAHHRPNIARGHHPKRMSAPDEAVETPLTVVGVPAPFKTLEGTIAGGKMRWNPCVRTSPHARQ